MDILKAVIVAIIEGITEYLPISSTGHMIITEKLLGVPSTDFTKTYKIVVQLGAIVSVVVLYWKKFIDFKKWKFYAKLIVALIPAITLALLFEERIDAMLESPLTVSLTMLTGGVLLLFIDNIFKEQTIQKEEDISFRKALMIGIWQCIALVPGISRSAASIIGGMQQKLTRSLAAEFSFFLAVPTLFAAAGFKLIREYKNLGAEEIKLLAIGNVVAFIVALLAIKFFIGFLQKHGFRLFGFYRIIVGIILLVLILMGYLK